MARLSIPSLEAVPAGSKPTLEVINKQLGVVPNLYRLIGQSSIALEGFSRFHSELSKALDVKTRERIALVVAQINGCNYCLAAHTYLGLNVVKMSPEEIALNRQGGSGDHKARAAVRFAAQVARERGHVSQADIDDVQSAGFSEAQIVDIVALVAMNSFTNYLNEVAKTDIDFPEVQAAEAA